MTFCETSIITALYCTIKRHPQGIERGPLRNKQEQYTSRGFYHQTTYSIKSLVNFYNFLVCLDTFSRKKNSHQASTLPTIETCFNCFGTRSSHTKKIIKDNKTTRENSKVAKMFSTPPGQGEVAISKMAQVPEGEFAHHTRPVGEQLCINCHNLKQFKTVHKRIRQNRCNRYTIHQSRIIFPHTQLGTDSRGKG